MPIYQNFTKKPCSCKEAYEVQQILAIDVHSKRYPFSIFQSRKIEHITMGNVLMYVWYYNVDADLDVMLL